MSKLFVGGLSKALYQDSNLVKDYFSQFGRITHIKPMKKFNEKRNDYGYYCFIRFKDGELPIQHILKYGDMRPHIIWGKKVDVQLSLDVKKDD